ncbi:MAG: sulfotransferase [Arenicellales bacterium]
MTDTLNPFFLVYDSRSGSTFLAKCMVKDLDLVIPPESNFLDRILIKFPKAVIENRKELSAVIEIINGDEKFKDWRIDLNLLYDCHLPVKINEFVSKILNLYGSGSGYGVKKGNLIYRHAELGRLFPESKFICIVRDGRAVYSSKKISLHSKTGKPFDTDPVNAARKWVTITKLMNEIENENRGIAVKYEDLIQTPNRVINRIAGYLSLSAVGDNSRNGYVVPLRYSGLHENINNSPMVENIQKWRKYLRKDEIFLFEREAYETLVDEGYKPIFTRNELDNSIRYWWVLLKLKVRDNLFN